MRMLPIPSYLGLHSRIMNRVDIAVETETLHLFHKIDFLPPKLIWVLTLLNIKLTAETSSKSPVWQCSPEGSTGFLVADQLYKTSAFIVEESFFFKRICNCFLHLFFHCTSAYSTTLRLRRRLIYSFSTSYNIPQARRYILWQRICDNELYRIIH
jgi:hypothetical protein